MTASPSKPRNEQVSVSVTSSTLEANADGRMEAHPHRSSLVKKHPSFHFPPSVLAFFQEECNTTDSEYLDISAITPNSTFDEHDADDTDSHPSLEERQPHSHQPQNLADCDNEERDVEQIVSQFGSTFDHEEHQPKGSLQACLDMLSSHDLDLNRVGLQRLFLLTRGRALSGLYHSEVLASRVLVFGGQFGSLEDRLQYAFCTMICDAPHEDTGIRQNTDAKTLENDENISDMMQRAMDGHLNSGMGADWDGGSCEDDSISSEDCETEGPQGKEWGALHLQGLKVLTNALAQISSSQQCCGVDHNIRGGIPFHGTVWRNITHTLVHNIETNHTADITGYSLRILRLLHAVQPDMVQPLLQQTLFPHLVFLQQFGHDHLFPIIHSEATYLLRRANYLW
jgi:hypothetical protein